MTRSRKMSGDYCDGFVGGEVTDPGADIGYCPEYGDMCHVADRLGTGSEHEYLGHFRQQKYARKGHNDIEEPGLPPLKVPTATLPNQQQSPLPQPKAGNVGGYLRALGLSGSSEPDTGGLF